MNIRTTFAIAGLSLLLFSCRQEKEVTETPFLQGIYHEALELQRKGNLNDAIFQYQLIASLLFISHEDSLTYWWKAMCGQGDIWLQKNFPDYAQSDFETVLEFAREQRLDTAEFIACRRLTDIALHQHRYEKAYDYNRRALQLAREKAYPENMTRGLVSEELLSRSALSLSRGLPLADSLYTRLEALATDTVRPQEERCMALRLLALQNPDFLPDFLKLQDEVWDTRYRRFTDEAEREKKELIAERDAIAQTQRDWLFTGLTLFALFIGGGIYATAHYRRRHELERIHLLLDQKMQTIEWLEKKQEEDQSLRLQLREKEMLQADLTQRGQEIQEMQGVIKGTEDKLQALNQQMQELEQLYEQLEQKQQEWKKTERQIRRSHLYDLPIGQLLPTPDNPHPVDKAKYENLLTRTDRQETFLQEMDHCFNHFASGLRELTPGLTMEDIIFCCLFHLNIRPTDIASITATSRSNVSKKRIRLENKLSHVPTTS